MLAAAFVLVAGGGAAALAPEPTPPASRAGRAPYDNAPVAGSTITLTLDLAAARAILAVLSAPAFDADAAKALETLPAVQAAIRESKRPPEAFEHDLAAAFDEQARITGFDFRRIREDRGRWNEVVTMIAGREKELTQRASERALAAMPGDWPLALRQTIFLTFGLPGRADHLAVPEAGSANWSIVSDLSRLIADSQASPASEQIDYLSRLMAAEAYRRAWAEYRVGSPSWQKRDPALGQLEPLMRKVAEAGPVAIYSVDENFFPLAVWLKQPMKDDLDELNRAADRLMATGEDLDARMAVATEIQKPEFTSSVAGPAGAFLADGIFQALGLDAYRGALAGGPRAFFEAYERAAQRKGSGLVPLGKAIRDQLAAAARAKQ
jgi:hypothetical protein